MTKRVSIRIRSNRCPECVKHQRIIIGITDYIADNSPVVQVQDSTEIDFLFLSANRVLERNYLKEAILFIDKGPGTIKYSAIVY